MNKRYKEFSIAAIISLLCILSLFFRSERLTYSHPDFNQNWDHKAYIEMAANNPFNYHTAPFAWRVLNPLLAKILPFDLLTNFTLLSALSLLLTGIFTYLLLRRADFSNSLAITGLLFFMSLGWATRFNINDFWLTDPLSFLFITASIWCIFAKKDLLFLIFLAIGVTAKENVIFVAPLYYTLNSRKLIDFKLLFRASYLCFPALVVLILLRIIIQKTNIDYNIFFLIENIGYLRLTELTTSHILSYTITTFGISLIFLPIFSFKTNLAAFLKFSPFILLSYSSLLFAVNSERLIVSAFPAIIIMALLGIRNIIIKTECPEELFIVLPSLLFVLLLIKDKWHVVSFLVESFLLLIILAISMQYRRNVISNEKLQLKDNYIPDHKDFPYNNSGVNS